MRRYWVVAITGGFLFFGSVVSLAMIEAWEAGWF